MSIEALLSIPTARIRPRGEPQLTHIGARPVTYGRLPDPGIEPADDVVVGTVRELTAADFAELEYQRERTAAMNLDDLKPLHRSIARMVAQGFKNVQISEALGVHVQTILNLKNTATFQETVRHFMHEMDASAKELPEKMLRLAHKGVDRIGEMLETGDSETVTPAFLRDVTFGLLDRLGHSPVQRQVSANIGVLLQKEDLEEIRATALTIENTAPGGGDESPGDKPAAEVGDVPTVSESASSAGADTGQEGGGPRVRAAPSALAGGGVSLDDLLQPVD